MGHDSDTNFDGVLYMNGEPIGRCDEIREITFDPAESSAGSKINFHSFPI